MELKTISQVSKSYGISTRMLRYYEQMGLIQSVRESGYAYRVYDETAICRLRQIVVLRKLRIPLKQITNILNNSEAVMALEIFEQNMSQIDEEMTALSTIKSILALFIEEIKEKTDVSLNLLGDESIFSLVSYLSFSDNKIKEVRENVSITELNKASESLSKITDKDVRIVYLPPMTVAAAYAEGDGCEGKSGDIIKQFIQDSGLLDRKPDLRSFGFDCSKGSVEIGENSHIYEMWVSVPDDMAIPEPLIRREFRGGLYAAHVLRSWDFEDWRLLGEWVNASETYENDWGAPRWSSSETVFGQGFEETLNFYNYAKNGSKMEDMQLDLLFPIKVK